MRFAWLLLGLAVVTGLAGAFVPDWRWLHLVAVPVGLVASLVLLLRKRRKAPPAVAQPKIIVDGSNVIHWNGGAPSLEPLRAVIRDIEARGMTPGVIFDANAGYKINDRYLDDGAFASLLGLPDANVLVVPKGTPADRYILEAARSMGARIVTNDRFRDWEDSFPEVRQTDLLIRGGFREGRLWLKDRAARQDQAR